MKANFFGSFLILVSTISTASATVRYVDLNCPTPTPPYTDWSTAATNIQDAVDAVDGNDLILVTNGVYASGCRLANGTISNRLVMYRSGITVQSVNGPQQTIIQGWQVPGTTNGAGAIRCVYLTGTVVLSGFTLSNGATLTTGNLLNDRSGGAVWASSGYPVVTNCIISGNSAANNGGGVYGACSLSDCVISGNWASTNGGGASRLSNL